MSKKQKKGSEIIQNELFKLVKKDGFLANKHKRAIKKYKKVLKKIEEHNKKCLDFWQTNFGKEPSVSIIENNLAVTIQSPIEIKYIKQKTPMLNTFNVSADATADE